MYGDSNADEKRKIYKFHAPISIELGAFAMYRSYICTVYMSNVLLNECVEWPNVCYNHDFI